MNWLSFLCPGSSYRSPQVTQFWRSLISSSLLLGLGINASAWAGEESSDSPHLSSEHSAAITALVTPSVFQYLPPEWRSQPITYPSFNSQRLDQQLALYADYLRTEGVPDVLIVGSSRALQGVDPAALQTALMNQGYPPLQIYNFSINGATAQVVDLVLRRILSPDQLPRLILWADGSRAFNSGRDDLTYNGIAASEGYKRLATGDRPITLQPELSVVEIYPWETASCEDVLGPVAESSASAQHLHSPMAIATSTSSPTVYFDSLPCARVNAEIGADPRGDRGLFEHSPLIHSSAPTSDLNATGFQIVLNRFDPSTYYRQYPRVPGQYDSNYVPFNLQGEQTQATLRLVQYVQSLEIPIVFVNLPLSQEYLDPVRQRYEVQFQQTMQQLAQQERFIFLNLMGQWAERNDFFADPSHLNRYGAEAVSAQLAIAPAIPWNRLRTR